jgi:hypothetical protein
MMWEQHFIVTEFRPGISRNTENGLLCWASIGTCQKAVTGAGLEVDARYD